MVCSLFCPCFQGVIADMSLDILHEVGSFKIKHLPNEDVKVRIGNHTGSCCAGKFVFFFNVHFLEFDYIK